MNYKTAADSALVCVMCAGTLAGMLAETLYGPFVVLATIGLVYHLVYDHGAPRPAVGYAVLAACMLLTVASYTDMKQVLAEPDAYGIACMAGAMAGLATAAMRARPRTPHAVRA